MRILGRVEAQAGRLEPIDSPRAESIFVTWSPKIFIEASAWRVYWLWFKVSIAVSKRVTFLPSRMTSSDRDEYI